MKSTYASQSVTVDQITSLVDGNLYSARHYRVSARASKQHDKTINRANALFCHRHYRQLQRLRRRAPLTMQVFARLRAESEVAAITAEIAYLERALSRSLRRQGDTPSNRQQHPLANHLAHRQLSLQDSIAQMLRHS